jgi:hypothetical protein
MPEGLSFHGLRRDFTSLLARLCLPLRVAMDMLCCSHELMMIYCQHAGDGDRRQAAEKIGDWLRAGLRKLAASRGASHEINNAP